MGLLFDIKVRKVSKSECLSRLYELENEVKTFLRENKNNLHVQFDNEEFAVMLAYLDDVFGHLNDMSLSLQDRGVIANDFKEKLAKLTARMKRWRSG